MRPLLCCVLLAFVWVGCAPAPAPTDPGARVYQTTCATCHQPDGRGLPGIYPSLHGTEWVTGDEGRLVRLVLHGVQGPMEVDGVTYNNVMTAHGFLSDDQIASVLSYVRDEFGSGGTLDPDDVAAVRAASARRTPWSADELRTATGIPAP